VPTIRERAEQIGAGCLEALIGAVFLLLVGGWVLYAEIYCVSTGPHSTRLVCGDSPDPGNVLCLLVSLPFVVIGIVVAVLRRLWRAVRG
jgi:hypothetical protein